MYLVCLCRGDVTVKKVAGKLRCVHVCRHGVIPSVLNANYYYLLLYTRVTCSVVCKREKVKVALSHIAYFFAERMCPCVLLRYVQ